MMFHVMIMSAVMAAMVGEVASILFTATLVMDLCDFFDINPTRYLIAVVVATNIGS